jgi:hypothetical protein
MRELGKKLRSKLADRSGESIAEVLLSILVSALALLMLALMISSATNMIVTRRDRLEEYYEKNNDLTTLTGDKQTGTLTLDKPLTQEKTVTYDIEYFENDTVGKTVVISYKEKEATP